MLMGCAPIVSTMTSSGSMTTAKRSTGRLAIKRFRLVRREEGSVPSVINTGLDVRDGWYRCTAEIAGTHWLHAERPE